MKTLYMLILTLVSHLALAQTTFVTRWNLATAGSGATELSFGVGTDGTVSYTWAEVSPGTATGSGTFTGNFATITGLPVGKVIDLRISPANFRYIIINSYTDRYRLVDVKQWGTTAWTAMSLAFSGCSNLQISATDLPNLNGVNYMNGTFAGCTSLNGPANIGSWNTGNVIAMNQMFFQAVAFNQPIGNWNTENVTNMANMFNGADAFNQPIGNWKTGQVTNMNSMFASADAFDQPIGTWDTGNVTDMNSMFASAGVFNHPIGTWNTEKVTTMYNMFFQAFGFDQPIGAWNTANVTNMGNMFYRAYAFNQPIGNWNTAKVTNMNSTFYYASAFNQSLTTWNTAKVTNMDSMFRRAGAFNQSLGSWTLNASVNLTDMFNVSDLDCDHYSATLIGWSANPATPTGRSLGALNRLYGTNSVAARTNLTTTKGWTITNDVASGADCSALTEFVTRWDLATAGSGATQLSFGVGTVGTVSYTWAEVSPGTASGSGTFNGSTATITGLPSGKVIDLIINPTNFRRIYINYGADRNRLVDVRQWGTTAWTSMAFAFYGCSNLQISATDLPNLSGVNSMSSMFSGCTILNGPSNIGSWNTGSVASMNSMFASASAFNQPIELWNTANVTGMNQMFFRATAFNQPIGTWNTAKVTEMSSMFANASAFNQTINSQPNEVWNMSNVTSMNSMFAGAAAFNQPIGNWDTGKVTDMSIVFSNAVAFNQPLSDWNTVSATSMFGMFSGATTFNQPIGAWNTANVTRMESMFRNATAFNQSLSNWNTANVADMSYTFYQASSFNKSLGSWTLNASVVLTSILSFSGLDCEQYSATLIGWGANPATPAGRSLGASGRSYGTNAVAARTNLTAAKGWTITNDVASRTDCSATLPVTLISFSGKKTAENQNTLKWITADEKDFDRFEVQRSSDARSFETIGVVQGQGAEGLGSEAPRSQLLSTYTFTDPTPGASNYYRLKMVDRAANGRDGSFEYSRIISMENSSEQAVVGSFYPNPSNGKVFVDVYAVESGSWTLSVTDAGGKTISNQVYDLQKGMNKIALSRLKPGINLVRFEHGQYSEVRKLISE